MKRRNRRRYRWRIAEDRSDEVRCATATGEKTRLNLGQRNGEWPHLNRCGCRQSENVRHRNVVEDLSVILNVRVVVIRRLSTAYFTQFERFGQNSQQWMRFERNETSRKDHRMLVTA